MNVATPTSFQRARVQSYQEEEELEQVRSSTSITSELKLRSDWGAVLQMDDSEGTVRQIGAFSEGINNLTVSFCLLATRPSLTGPRLIASFTSPVCFRAC